MTGVLSRQKGLSLIEVVVAIGIFSIITLVTTQVMTSFSRIERLSESSSNIEEIRNLVLLHLNNENHWRETLMVNAANAAVFSCIRNATDCRGAGGEFQIFSSAVPPKRLDFVTLTTGAEAGQGFNNKGACNQFGASDMCPYKYTARWQAVCPQTQNLKIAGGAVNETMCRNPIIDVFVDLNFQPANPQNFPAFNTERFRVRISKSQIGSDPVKLCQMMSGAMVGGVCNPATLTNCVGVCASGDPVYVIGFNPNGTPICDCAPNVPVVACNPSGAQPGQVLIGVDSSGSPNCAPGLIPVLQNSGAWANPPLMGT